MNKNKLIFAIIWALLLLLIFYVVLNLKSSPWNNNWNTSVKWDFSIWIVWDEVSKANNVVNHFKSIYPAYSSLNIKVESFPNFDDYYMALSSAIIQDKTPDLFVLNNNEKQSLFSEQVVWISSDTINPNDFRKKYKWVFADDLIITSGEGDQKEEFLMWLPVWYETLWIFYNRRYIKDSDLDSLAWLNNIVAELKNKYPDLVPIWIGNWSTVYNVSDIISQFFMLESWVTWISDVVWNKLKQSFTSYFLFWDTVWNNSYDSRFLELTNLWQTSLDLFSKWDTFMVIWYPRVLNTIKEKWFSKNFLLAADFPHYFSWEWKTLLNYNYFVINKDTTNYDLATSFLSYLSSDTWANEYFKNFPYYLPAMLSLESDLLQTKVDPDYNIVLWDFINDDYLLSSFDKWIKNIYDKEIINILDNSSFFERDFEKFKQTILCKKSKITTLENLSKSCE